MKKVLAMMLSCILTLSLSLPAFAAEVTPATDGSAADTPTSQGEMGITPCASDIPTSSTTLPYTATVTNLCEGCGTYTLYYFKTTTGYLKIGGTLKSSGDNNDTAIDSYTVDQFVESTTLSHTFRNLSSDKNYYILIKNTTGWGMWKDLWISGNVSISE